MEENKIILGKSNVLKLAIYTDKGEKTGEYLEFDLEDIELPLRYAKLVEEDKQNKKWLRDEQLIIKKREDVQSKGQLMSKNTMDTFAALEKFFKKEVEIYNKFLGENGVQKLLNGQKLGWTSLEMIDKIIEKQILPHLQLGVNTFVDKIKSKYGEALEHEKKILELE